MLPYQGVKFIPKLSHKYNSIEPISNFEERTKQLGAKKECKKLQEIEVNKPMVVLNEKKTVTVTQTVTRLNNSLNKNNCNKENSMSIETTTVEVKTMNSTTSGCCGNDSILSNKAGNLSTLSNSSRKRVDLKPMQLHTEARAQKRYQYDKYLKDKERMAELMKKNIEMQKMIESKNDVQKLRSQLLFKSKPFKQVKPMEIRPSEKPLTEPKSPSHGMFSATTSTSRLNLMSINKTATRSLSQDNIRIA
jgi:targeting protein for Xklp2